MEEATVALKVKKNGAWCIGLDSQLSLDFGDWLWTEVIGREQGKEGEGGEDRKDWGLKRKKKMYGDKDFIAQGEHT